MLCPCHILSYSRYKQITSKKQRTPVYYLFKLAVIIKKYEEQKKTDSKNVQGGLQGRLRSDRVKDAEVEPK